MHPIKFRLWDGSSMQPVGSITFHTDGSYHVNDEYPVNDDTMEKQFGGNRYHLMQFTGLKDKNGKEIWEGDIVEFKSEYLGMDEKGYKLMKVKSVKETVEFKHGWFYPNSGVEEGEVIGNIYENPELLNPKSQKL